MIKHIVAWSFTDGFTAAQNAANAEKIKQGLEALAYLDGAIEITVHTNLLPKSTHDIMMDSTFESEEALAAYKVHPEHVLIGDFIGSVMKNRIALNFEI